MPYVLLTGGAGFFGGILKRQDAVFHCAAVLAHGMSIDGRDLWALNVGATVMLAEACRDYGVPKLIFTSTNCLLKWVP